MEIKKIEATSTIILLPLFLVGLLFSLNFAISTTLGGLIMITNLFFLSRGIQGVFSGKQRKLAFFLQHTLRLVLLISIIYLFFCWKKIDIAGFVVGLSIVFWGILVCVIKENLLPTKKSINSIAEKAAQK